MRPAERLDGHQGIPEVSIDEDFPVRVEGQEGHIMLIVGPAGFDGRSFAGELDRRLLALGVGISGQNVEAPELEFGRE